MRGGCHDVLRLSAAADALACHLLAVVCFLPAGRHASGRATSIPRLSAQGGEPGQALM